MNLAQIQARLQQLFAEVETLRVLDSRTEEQDARIVAIRNEVADLVPQAERLQADAEMERRARAIVSLPAGDVAARDSGNGNTEEVDRRSPMERFLASDAFAQYRARPKGQSGAVSVGSFFDEVRQPLNLDARQNADEPISNRELRALILTTTGTAAMRPADIFPTIYRGRERPLRMRDVLVAAQTDQGSVTILQEGTFTNNAAEVAEATSAVSGNAGYTAALKPESALTFTEATFNVQTIAHWVPITRQALDDLAFLRTYVEARLFVGLERRENSQIINGNGTAPNLRGILNTTGVQVLDGTYFTANPVNDATQDNENFNRILRAISLISRVGEAEATFIAVNPVNYETLLTYTDANRQYYGPGPFSGAGVPTIWGRAVVEETGVPAGRVLVGDGLMAAVVDRMDAQIFVADQHADFFTHNMFAFLAEERLALPVFRPVAFADVTLA